MPVFAYSALDATDRVITGTLIAESPVEGRQQIRERGLSIQSFQLARFQRLPRMAFGFRKRKQERSAEFARYLGLLIRAGVSLAESLDVLARECPRRFAAVLKDVRDRIAGGEPLADALGRHTVYFDEVFVSAVRMGELSGNLEEALCELAVHLRSRQALQNRLTSALAYPLILVVVGTGVVLFLMSYVVPQLTTVLEASARPLPASTALLKNLADLLIQRWAILIAMVILLALGIWLALTHPRVRRKFQELILRIPVLGPLLRKAIVARFAQQTALLLKTGIPFVDAIRSVCGQTRNLVLISELNRVADAVESGSDIAPMLVGSRIFPPVVAQLVAVGQDSGELTEMLAELRDRFDEEVQLALGRFATILEPLLIVILATVIGFVVFACLMPILEATRGIA